MKNSEIDLKIEKMLNRIDSKINKIKENKKKNKRFCLKCSKQFIPLHKDNKLCEKCGERNRLAGIDGSAIFF